MAVSEKLRKRLEKRKKDIKSGGNYDTIIFPADTTTRIRILNPGDDEDFAEEATTFFLGKDIGTVISPATYGEPCAIMEMYNDLKKGDEDDKELADTFKPSRGFFAPAIKYNDEKGKEVNTDLGVKLAKLPKGVYDTLIDLVLDDENGEFFDKKDGYDLKIKREGSGRMDTKYTVIPCKNTPTPKKFNGVYNPIEMIKKLIPTFEETEEKIAEFLNLGKSDDEPKKKKKKSSKEDTSTKKKKKKKKTSDM